MTETAHPLGRDYGRLLRRAAWAGAAFLFLLPAVAMQFTDEVKWDLADFVIFGIMLLAAALPFDLATRRPVGAAHHAAVAIGLGTGFLLVWVNLAVGIIGSEANPWNLLYAGVLAVGVVGGFRGRSSPAGLMRAMFATGLTQLLAGALALGLGLGHVRDVAGATLMFTAFWFLSAWLFRVSARRADLRPA